MHTAELVLDRSSAMQLVTHPALGGDVQVRVAWLITDDAPCRVQLTGPPSLVGTAEAFIWRTCVAAADAAGWSYLDARGKQHGPCSTAQLKSWRSAGYFPDALPVKNGCSTNWLSLGLLLKERRPQADIDSSDMEVDLIRDEVAQLRECLPDAEAMHGDISMPDAGPLPSAAVLVLVIDTCTLLGCFSLLQRRLTGFCGAAVALVPWAVLYELDGLKSSPKEDVARLARSVTSGLERLLLNESHLWRGQSPQEERLAAAEAEQLRPIGGVGGVGVMKVTGDEKVIRTCIVLQKQGTRSVILSDDTNLRVRASVCSVRALPRYTLPSTLTELHELAHSIAGEPPANAPLFPASDAPMPPAPPDTRMLVEPCLPQASTPAALVDAALACLQRGCSGLVEASYRSEFADHYDIAVQDPQPWSGRTCLKLLTRGWKAVFQTRLPREVLQAATAVEEAVKLAQRRREDGHAAEGVVMAVCTLLAALPSEGEMLQSREDAEALRQVSM
jgi:hypothetical protein